MKQNNIYTKKRKRCLLTSSNSLIQLL